MLEINDIDVFYGDLQALWEVSLVVNEGEFVSLIGPNGAGKTTTLRTICGLLTPAAGNISFLDNDLKKETTDKIVNMGISQVPEGGNVFASMTVMENHD